MSYEMKREMSGPRKPKARRDNFHQNWKIEAIETEADEVDPSEILSEEAEEELQNLMEYLNGKAA